MDNMPKPEVSGNEVAKKVEILEDIFTPKGHCIVARSPHFKEIINRLIRGESSRDIERWLIQNKGETDRISHHAIWSYRRRHIPDGILFESNYIKDRYKEKIKQLSEIDELENLIMAQSARVSAIHEQEDKDGKIHPTLFREITTLKDLLKATAELKMDLGLMKKAPTKHEMKLKGAGMELPKGVTMEGLTRVLAIADVVSKKKGDPKSTQPDSKILH